MLLDPLPPCSFNLMYPKIPAPIRAARMMITKIIMRMVVKMLPDFLGVCGFGGTWVSYLPDSKRTALAFYAVPLV